MASTATEHFKRTLIDFSLPNRSLSKEILLTLGFTFFIGIASQVSFTPPLWYTNIFSSIGIPIDGTPVPITLQTLAVGFTGAILGSRMAIQSLLLYILAGLAGLPAFAGSVKSIMDGTYSFGLTGGSIWGEISFFALPSGGYIIGFVLAGYIIGKLAEKGWSEKIITTASALIIGNISIYLIGLPWLYIVLSANGINMDLGKTLDFGLWPFIPGDLIKIALVVVTLPSAWKIISIKKKKEN
tara:strand:- start:132 stop:854 length:723 start_codon:yes stop_codon:yes gene_type:complete